MTAVAVVAPMITPAVATLISAGIGLFSSSRSRRDARRRSAEALKRQQEQQARLDEEIEKYRAIEFKNPYQNIENPFEDLTVNQQAAKFQAQQIQQQQANLLEGFKGAAGSSGIAGLAQVLANQGALQTQKASASIAQQEQANQRAAASADLRIQQLEGAGDAMVQQAESSRQATILGMNQSVMAGVNANYQRQLQNQQYANAAANKTMINSLSSLATLDLENLGGSTNTQSTSSYAPYQMDPNQTQNRPIVTTDPNAGGDFNFNNNNPYKI